MQKKWRISIGLAIIGFILCGSFRVYTGQPIGFKIIEKNSFSFTDTVVNLDDILGMPRIAVATQHPAVKRQMEEMGWTETDEVAQEKMEQKIKEKMAEAMQDSERQAKEMMQRLGQ